MQDQIHTWVFKSPITSAEIRVAIETIYSDMLLTIVYWIDSPTLHVYTGRVQFQL